MRRRAEANMLSKAMSGPLPGAAAVGEDSSVHGRVMASELPGSDEEVPRLIP